MKITTFSELTIDGRVTLECGMSSKALFDFYGDELRHWFHAKRAAHDAIMVGAATVRADNPQLTARHATSRNPLRVIPTNDGNIPAGSHILSDGLPTLFVVPKTLVALSRWQVVDWRLIGGVGVSIYEPLKGTPARHAMSF